MFSPGNPTTKSIIKATKSEKGYIVWSHYYNLPNKRVLLLTHDEERTITTLKIYSIDNLHSCLAKKTLKDSHRLLCIFPDGTILLQKEGFLNNSSLIKTCSTTLNTISVQPWKHAYSAAAINNDSFFIITRTDESWRTGKLERFLTIYQWTETKYKEYDSIQLSVHPGLYAEMHYIQDLGNNRYCCHLRGNNTSDFRVLVFGIDAKTYAVKELGVIQPKAQHSGGGSAASGELTVLANGQLLTYHACHDNVQIWDTKTLSCVKEWNWSDIKTPNEFSAWCLNITAFPDPTFLLVHKGESIFLFNTDKLVMKQIELGSKVESYGNHHILSNGQVLAFVKNKPTLSITQFDLTANYRKIINESQHLMRLFFNRQQFPTDATNHIFSYAYSQEAREIYVKNNFNSDASNAENETDNSKKSNFSM